MDSLGLGLSLIIALALVLQGASCFVSEKRPLSLGFLDLILAGIVILFAIGLFTGGIVLGAEFGAIMTQGRGTTWLKIALLLAPVLPSLCWYGIRRLNDQRSHLWLFLLPALLLGVWATTRLHAINPSDPEELRVYLYDVWWPPIVVWLITCFAGSILAIVHTEARVVCLAFSAALLPPVARFALSFEDLADPQSSLMWMVVERGAFLLAVVTFVFLFAQGLDKRLRAALLLLSAGIASGFAFVKMSDIIRGLFGIIPLIPLLAGIIAVIAQNIRNQSARETDGGPQVMTHVASKPFPIRRLSGIAFSVVLPLIAICVLDLFSIGYLNRSLEVAILFVFWIFLAEHIAQGALDTLPKMFKNGVLQFPMLKNGWGRMSNFFAGAKKKVSSMGAFLVEGSASVVTVKAAIASIMGLIIIMMGLGFLAALDEALNHTSIVIGAFRWTGSNDMKEDIAQEFSLGLVNALGRLRSDLRPDSVIPRWGGHPASHEQLAGARVLRAGADSDSLGAAVAKSDDLEVSGLKIHPSFFAVPVQRLVRRIMNTKVIEGNIKRSADGGFVVLVNSSDADNWMEVSTSTQSDLPNCLTDESQHVEPLYDLIDRVAFRIASSDSSFIAAGLTQNWTAFRYVRLGLKHWSSYIERRDRRELKNSISCFEESIRQDRGFAFAYYRLGLAMQHYGEPMRALEAFRESTAVNSDFIPGASMEAETISNFTAYYPPAPAIADRFPPILSSSKALKIWARIAQLPRGMSSLRQRRSAYLGICENQLDKLKFANEQPLVYVPYFFCSRAQVLFYRLATPQRLDTEEKQLQAEILNVLGTTLDNHRREYRVLPAVQFPGSWSCWNKAIDEDDLRADGRISKIINIGSRTSRAALHYYRESLKLDPDKANVRCNVATAEAYLNANDMDSMKRLADDPQVHFMLADLLDGSAHNALATRGLKAKEIAVGYYRRALNEYQAAIRLDPAFVIALNRYAYTFWEWEIDWLSGRTGSPPDPDMASQAEAYAREGIRITRCLRPPDSNQMTDMEMTVRDTLGEVLLAEGRMKEAIEYLEPIVTVNPEWDGLNETRWDLAQAKICDASAANENKERQMRMFEAMRTFADIQKDERDSDVRPFSTTPGAFDPLLRAASCPAAPGEPGDRAVPLTLRKVTYDYGSSCAWSSVVAQVFEDKMPVAGYVLHVWGGGLDVRAVVDKTPMHSILLDNPATARHTYYYGQLEDQSGRIASLPISVDTYPNRTNDVCSRNRVTLVFTRQNEQLLQNNGQHRQSP